MSPMRMICCWCFTATLLAGATGCQTWGGSNRYFYPDKDMAYRNSGTLPEVSETSRKPDKPKSEVSQVSYENEAAASSRPASADESAEA